jgi:hypothetical protein
MMQVFTARVIMEMKNNQAELRQLLTTVVENQRQITAQFEDKQHQLDDLVKTQQVLSQLVAHVTGPSSSGSGAAESSSSLASMEAVLAAQLSGLTEDSNRMRQRTREINDMIVTMQGHLQKLESPP